MAENQTQPQQQKASPSHVFIRNNEDRVRGISLPARGAKDLKSMDPKATLQMVHQDVTLKPGINRIDARLWTAARPHAALLLKTTTKESKGRPVLEEIAEPGSKQSSISEIFDRELLRDMLEQADSETAPFIQAQLKRISPKEGLDGEPIVDAMGPAIAKARAEGKR